MAERWFDKSVKQTEFHLNTSTATGLNAEEVRKRRARDGENNIYAKNRQPIGHYLRHILTDYTSLLMLVTLLVAAVFDETENLVVMLAILATYYVIVIFSYIRSENVLGNISSQALPTAKVLRDGKLYIVRQKELVRGDVIYLSTGDIVPCDARLCETDGLEILESAVTGATSAVRKDAKFVDYHDISPDAQKNMLFATTIVTRGVGVAICVETGQDCLVCKMNKNRAIESDEQADIFEAVNSFCKKWTIFMTLGILVLTILDIIISRSGNGIFDSFMLGISAAVASMSEFYTAFAYISLAVGIYSAVNRKGKINKGSLIKNSYKLEQIKNLSCLIIPKEAGFSAHDRALAGIYVNDDFFTPQEHGFRRNASRVLRYSLLSTGLYGADRLLSRNQRRDNVYSSEEEVIINAAENCGEYNVSLEQRYPMLQHISAGSDSQFDTTLVRFENGYVVALRGEYGKVLPLCSHYTENGRVYEMTPEKMTELTVEAEKLTRESHQVIAIASKDTIYNNLRRLSACQTELTLEGMIVIKQSILPESAKNVSRCRAAGIRVIMLCDDEDDVNYGVAESLGIASKREEMITSGELSRMNDGMLRLNLNRYSVYVGLTLRQKRELVSLLRDEGETVGYLCSELDEIILLKDADVGFSHRVTISDRGSYSVELADGKVPVNARNSMQTRESGCEALKFVSDVIISDPDIDGTGGFNAVTDAILCAKAVYNNMHRMIKYMLSSQIAKLIIVFLSVVSPYTVCTPAQILFCGLIIDFLALISIAFEKPTHKLLEKKIETERLKKPLAGNIPAALLGILWSAVTEAVVVLMLRYQVISRSGASACFFIIFIVSQLMMLSEYKQDRGVFGGEVRINGAHALTVVFSALFLFAVIRFPAFGIRFNVVRVPVAAIPGIAIVPIFIFAFCEITKFLYNKKLDRDRKKQDGD